jgi:hypothetical protein
MVVDGQGRQTSIDLRERVGIMWMQLNILRTDCGQHRCVDAGHPRAWFSSPVLELARSAW